VPPTSILTSNIFSRLAAVDTKTDQFLDDYTSQCYHRALGAPFGGFRRAH
jgi:hypothetical protein